MAFHMILPCLEALTDYREFERLCCDLLASTCYPEVVPLGGTKDGGRDGIVRHGNGPHTICAFSANRDKVKKIEADCRRIKSTQGAIAKLVFVSTAKFTAREQDDAHRHVREILGCGLDLFDQEWLRMQLAERPRLVDRYPGIFPPKYFQGEQPKIYAQTYLTDNKEVLSGLASAKEHLAVEIGRGFYEQLKELVLDAHGAQLVCFDGETRSALQRLQQSIFNIWEVISDEFYVHHLQTRVKFDNTHRPAFDVQAVLRAKQEELPPLIEKMGQELENFRQLASGERRTAPRF